MATTPQSAAISISNPDLAAQLSALLTGVAVAQLTDRAFLRISGSDAQRWLNGMVTNDIQALEPGDGKYNFLLNAQGRILGDCIIYRDETVEKPEFFLQTDKTQVDTIHQHLDKFIIMDDVELADISESHQVIVLAGPLAEPLLRQVALAIPKSNLRLLESTHVMHGRAPLVPRIEIWSDPANSSELIDHLTAATATPVSVEALEYLRILEGTPRYGIDIRNTPTAHDLPQETAQTRALHFSKGCYLGQEIVERIRSRGNVHRTFSGFELHGMLPAPRTALTAEGKSVGELTSVASIPISDHPVQLALGYVRREALDRKLPLEYPGGTATPIALPFAVS
jgi:folate-binding protein YgfZ